MPIPRKYLAEFVENGIYHVFNRTNNREKLFLSDENRRFFLKKFRKYLSPVVDTFCWCLLSNHFHFLIRVKSKDVIIRNIQSKSKNDRSITEIKFLENQDTIDELVIDTFKRFFQSYSQAFNTYHNRKGNFFYKTFRRVRVSTLAHLIQAFIYIHANPVKHQLMKDFTGYAWSSWHTYMSDAPTSLNREEGLAIFGGRKQFIKMHKELSEYYYDGEMAIED